MFCHLFTPYRNIYQVARRIDAMNVTLINCEDNLPPISIIPEYLLLVNEVTVGFPLFRVFGDNSKSVEPTHLTCFAATNLAENGKIFGVVS